MWRLKRFTGNRLRYNANNRFSKAEGETLKIAIVDDERIIREQVKNFIHRYCTDCTVWSYAAGEDLLAAHTKFDIIFLDIKMEGVSGIDTARELRRQQEDTVLIFVTGMKEYVFEAFDVSAFHYLLKPIDEGKLREVLGRAVGEAKKKKDGRRRQLFVRTKGRSLTIDQGDILYIESKAKKAEIHTVKETIEIYAAMSGLEEQLDERFYRCHRGYLVNMAYIVEYSADSISLAGGGTVYLTKKKHGEFVKAYMWFLQNGGVSCV